jgi:hypothetical protein
MFTKQASARHLRERPRTNESQVSANPIVFDRFKLQSLETESKEFAVPGHAKAGKTQIFENKGKLPLHSLKQVMHLSNSQDGLIIDKSSLFVCAGCNTPVFSGKDVVEHSYDNGGACGCLFIKQKDWVSH